MKDLWVHSDSNKNIGLFAIFMGGVVALPVPALLSALNRAPTRAWQWHLFGAALFGSGLLLFQFTRKRFRVESGKLTVHDGLLSPPVQYLWDGPADIHLTGVDTKHGEGWAVDLVCGKLYYRIHNSFDHLNDNLNLAVALARAVGGSLVGRSDSQPMVIPPEELGLAYRERARRHPQMLPRDAQRPSSCQVSLIETNGQQSFRWQQSWPQVRPYLMMLAFVMAILAGTVPLSGGDTARSAFQLAQAGTGYTYFILCGTILGGLMLVALGFQKELVVGPDLLCTKTSLWGIPVGRKCIPAGAIQDIWVRQVRNGAQLQFVSEGRCLGGQVSDLQVARWVASRVARWLVS